MPRTSDGNMALDGIFAIASTVPASPTINSYIGDLVNETTDSVSRSGKGAWLADLSAGGHQLKFLADGTQSTDAVTLRQVPLLGSDNVYTGASQTYKYVESGAAAGPQLILDRESTTPADNDLLGSIVFNGRDDLNNVTTYAAFGATAIDVTNPEEDGRLYFSTTIAGTTAERFYLGAGLYAANATGGDKGPGTANLAEALYINGNNRTGIIFAHGGPQNLTYKVLINSPIKFDINKTTVVCRSGNCTATWKINGTAIGGAASAVTPVEQIILRKDATTPETGITVNIGDDLEVTITAVSSCIDMDAMIEITRTG